MVNREVRVEGAAAHGTRIGARALKDILELTLEGSRRALRLRTQGRSTARGALPAWIEQATRYDVELVGGSTVLRFTGPTLAEADPEEFSQGDLFPELDPDLTAMDYLGSVLESALEGPASAADVCDREMLLHIGRYRRLFEDGISRVSYSVSANGRSRAVALSAPLLEGLSDLERRIPPSQQVRVSGKLDSIRDSDRTFGLLVGGVKEAVRGIANAELLDDLQQLWRKSVLVTGAAHFSASGKLLRVEADTLREAAGSECEVWGVKPTAIGVAAGTPTGLRVPQGTRSGLGAVIGKWPGDETDDELMAALAELS